MSEEEKNGKEKSISWYIGYGLSLFGLLSAFTSIIIYLTKLSDKVEVCCSQKVTAEDIFKSIKPYLEAQCQLIADIKSDIERLDRRIDTLSNYKIYGTSKVINSQKKVENKTFEFPENKEDMEIVPAK